MKVLALTALAILAFASNSLLTKYALLQPGISAAQFVSLRLVSGAAMLALLSWKDLPAVLPRRADLAGIASLFVYAVAFTFAYVVLSAATGAIILFPTVQLTLAAAATLAGVPPTVRQAGGLVIALGGLVVLLLPGLTESPPLAGTLAMVAAGVGWGVYTWLGRDTTNALARTSRNFIGSLPLALAVALVLPGPVPHSGPALLAIASGAVTSALGYVVWYAVLPSLNVVTAGAAQLLVPVITALTAVVWLGERPSLTLLAAAVLILGGLWFSVGPVKKGAH